MADEVRLSAEQFATADPNNAPSNAVNVLADAVGDEQSAATTTAAVPFDVTGSDNEQPTPGAV